jgi:hypothetical protein
LLEFDTALRHRLQLLLIVTTLLVGGHIYFFAPRQRVIPVLLTFSFEFLPLFIAAPAGRISSCPL